MPLPPMPECAKVRITYQDADNNQAMNLLHFKDLNGDLTATRAIDLSVVIQNWIGVWWDTVAVDDWKCVRIEVQGTNAGLQQYYDFGMDNSGAVTGNPLPNNVTLAISLRTGIAGRSYRGRLYHVGLAESMVSINDVVAPWNADIPNAYEELRTLALADDFVWGVASYFLDGEPRVEGLLTAINHAIITDNIVDTQRRRLPR